MKPRATANQLDVSIALAPGALVKGDPAKLQAVFQNLIENAMKYTPKGGKISISSEIKGPVLEVAVSDNGIGIPKDQQSRLFMKFFRAQNAMKVDTTGSGLGLFITKQIIDRHGGTIRFESEEQKGTTFFVQLPLFKP